MWSFGIVLWELATRNVPFADLSPMEAGMKVRKLYVPSNLIRTEINLKLNKNIVNMNFVLFIAKFNL